MTIDEHDRWTGIFGASPPVGGGILSDFVERQATRQLVLFPIVVVRRDAYQEVGGFCSMFHHVCDWDMWFRLGRHAPVALVPHPYALCRLYSECDTIRQRVSGANVRESYLLVKANLSRLKETAPVAGDQAWRHVWLRLPMTSPGNWTGRTALKGDTIRHVGPGCSTPASGG